MTSNFKATAKLRIVARLVSVISKLAARGGSSARAYYATAERGITGSIPLVATSV